MYQLTKRNGSGKIYTVIIDSDQDLVKHLRGCFEYTDHTVLAVIKIERDDV